MDKVITDAHYQECILDKQMLILSALKIYLALKNLMNKKININIQISILNKKSKKTSRHNQNLLETLKKSWMISGIQVHQKAIPP